MKRLTLSLTLIISTLFNFSLLAQWESIGSGISSGQRDIFSISVVDENNIWAIAAKTNFTASYEYTKTTDGGMTWQEGSLPDTIGNYYPGNIFALDEHTAWIIMINRPQQNHIKIFKTNDGGETWTEITIPASPRLGAIEFIEGTENTYLTNDGFQESSNMLLTTDGGMTWETLSNPPSMDCMQFLSPTVGFGGGAINPTNDVGLYKWIGNLSDSITTNTDNVFLSSDKLIISPNPASEILIVEFEKNNIEVDTLTVEISSIEGRLIHRGEYSSLNKIEIPISNLSSGIYNLNVITNEGKRVSKKFVKE